MRLSEVEKRARVKGIKDTWRYTKKDLIRAIQRSEGNPECFATGVNNCVYTSCCWREDCLR